MKKLWKYFIARMLLANGYNPGDIDLFHGMSIYNFIHGRHWNQESKEYKEVK